MYVVIVILLILIILFGVTSGLQSYATAQQAQAMIEVARVGQINSTANLITIMTLALVIVACIGLVVVGLWVVYRRSVSRRAGTSLHKQSPAFVPKDRDPLEQILELEKLRLLRDLGSSSQFQLTDNQPDQQLDQQPESDPLYWLR